MNKLRVITFLFIVLFMFSEVSSRNSWLAIFENWQSQTQSIHDNEKSLTGVTPLQFVVSADGKWTSAGSPNLCSTFQSYNLDCFFLLQNDQNDCTGLNNLFNSPSLQAQFIQDALNATEFIKANGVKVDFEPANNCNNIASAYAAFLNRLADAFHQKNSAYIVGVTIDNWGGSESLWDWQKIGNSSVDMVQTMATYVSSMTDFQNQVDYIYNYVPANKVGIGLQTTDDASNLTQRFQYIEKKGAPYITIWPASGNLLTATFWQEMASYLSGN